MKKRNDIQLSSCPKFNPALVDETAEKNGELLLQSSVKSDVIKPKETLTQCSNQTFKPFTLVP
jgi:hypothetical protein